MKFLDCHTHAYLTEDLPALKQRMAGLDSGLDDSDPTKWLVHGDGGLDSLKQLITESGAERHVLLPVSSQAGRVGELNSWAAQAGAGDERIIPFGMLHPQGELERDLEQLIDLGLKGVKIHPMMQRFELDHPATERMFELLAPTGLPLLTDTIDMEGLYKAKPHLQAMFGASGLPNCHPGQIARLARRHPELNIIAAHGGCLYGWQHLEPLMELDNVYFDISFLGGVIDPVELVGIIRQKGPQRIIYGSDAPWRNPARYWAWFQELPLTRAEKQQIAWATLAELLDI